MLSKEWVTGPPRERKTVLLRLKTTQPFSGLCVCVCVQYTSVCASRAHSEILHVFTKPVRGLATKAILKLKCDLKAVVFCVCIYIYFMCVCVHVGGFVLCFSGHLAQSFLREPRSIPASPCLSKQRGECAAVAHHSRHAPSSSSFSSSLLQAAGHVRQLIL